MTIPVRFSIIGGCVTLAGFGGLLALFYFSPTDIGIFPSVPQRTVLGQAVRRFSLGSDEIVIASKKGGTDNRDTALLTEDVGHTKRMIRVVNEASILLFEQSVATHFRTLAWNEAQDSFVVGSFGGDEILITRVDGVYTMSLP